LQPQPKRRALAFADSVCLIAFFYIDGEQIMNMKEKKKSDKVLAETPEQASSTRRKAQAPIEDYESEGQIDLRVLIARRAYEIYEERGRCDGEDVNDWLRAEAEVKSTLRPEKRRSVTSRARAGQ
jgi:H+-transporting ATPase